MHVLFNNSNSEIYTGKQPVGPFRVDNRAPVVKTIIFPSAPLALELANFRKSIIGTLRKINRKFLDI